jgi:HAMP domain-containing protein
MSYDILTEEGREHIMSKMLNSLQTKLTLSFVILILVVSSLTFFYTFGETKKALKEIVRTELVALSSLVAADLNGKDGDVLGALKVGDEKSPSFIELHAKLRRFKASHPDIKYVYTMRKVGEEVQFIVDADYGNEKDPGAAIGEKYEDTTPALLKGFEKPVAEKEFSTDKWGTLMSGFTPIRDSKNMIVGLVGIDMASNLVMEKQRFLGNTIYVIMGVGVLFAALIIMLFSATIIKDIKKLNTVANEISMGNTDVNMDVVRKDEIGELADSFGRMVASLKIMMSQDN